MLCAVVHAHSHTRIQIDRQGRVRRCIVSNMHVHTHIHAAIHTYTKKMMMASIIHEMAMDLMIFCALKKNHTMTPYS
jgi:hypothetical protein